MAGTVVCWGGSMSDNKFATAERATNKPSINRGSIELLSNGFNGQIRSAVHFYDKPVYTPGGLAISLVDGRNRNTCGG
jgi:hypothetical protein